MSAKYKKTLSIYIFAAMLALAGFLHVLENIQIPRTSFGYSLLNISTLCIYFGLLFYWIFSIFTRLLPSRAKNDILAAGALMLFVLLVRVSKYRIVAHDDIDALRYLWYCEYVGTLFIPTLFTMACMHSFYADTPAKHPDECWLLLAPILLMAIIATNDLHHWVFIPLNTGIPFTGLSLGYAYGWAFYLVSTYCVVVAVCGVILLIRISHRTHDPRKALVPLLAITGVALVMMAQVLMANNGIAHPYKYPEIIVFGMMAVYECCIRLHLFAYNENYLGFFGQAQLAAIISDDKFNPIYHTALPLQVDKAGMAAAKTQSVYIDPDTRLSCYTMRNDKGYLFYAEDESKLHDINRRLQQANDTIAGENELIQAENDVRLRQQHLRQRKQIYHQITAKMYPKQQLINAMLAQAQPNTEAFRTTVARVLAIDAYIKRGTNMLLSDAPFASGGMQLALAESAKYMLYCGIDITLDYVEDICDAPTAFALYTTYEDICEAHFGTPCHLVVQYRGRLLRIDSDSAPLPIQSALPTLVEGGPRGCTYRVAANQGGDGV